MSGIDPARLDPVCAIAKPHAQSTAARALVAELNSARPYDGRRVTLREKRGGWSWWGLAGVCARLSEDGRRMVLVVEHCPDNYWPVGSELLAELDDETVPHFAEFS